MAANTSQITVTAKWKDNASKGLKKLDGQLRGFRKLLLGVGAAGLAASVGIYKIAKSLIAVGAESEMYKTVLENLLGTQKKAIEMYRWLVEFAKTTPFQLPGLVEATTRLAAYGIKARDVLRTLGDTASAMGKSVMMTVEALADAQTGEFERLKEFGIKAIQDMGQTFFLYTDKFGKERRALIDRNNRAIITSTLLTIWNDKYKGMMDKASATWNGMMSTLADAWRGFKEKIAAAGIFDRLTADLKALLGHVERLDKEGKLDIWAKKISAALETLWTDLKKIKWDDVTKKVKGLADTVMKLGKWCYEHADFLAKAFVVATIVALIPKIYMLATALTALTAHPIVAGLAALGLGLAFVAKEMKETNENMPKFDRFERELGHVQNRLEDIKKAAPGFWTDFGMPELETPTVSTVSTPPAQTEQRALASIKRPVVTFSETEEDWLKDMEQDFELFVKSLEKGFEKTEKSYDEMIADMLTEANRLVRENELDKFFAQMDKERHISLIFDADASRVEDAVDLASFAVGKFVDELRGISPEMDRAINSLNQITMAVAQGNPFGAIAGALNFITGSRQKEEAAIHVLDRAIQQITKSSQKYATALGEQTLSVLTDALYKLEKEKADFQKRWEGQNMSGYGLKKVEDWETGIADLKNAIAAFDTGDLSTFEGAMDAIRHTIRMEGIEDDAQKLKLYQDYLREFVFILDDGTTILRDGADITQRQFWTLQETIADLTRETEDFARAAKMLSEAERSAIERTIGLKYAAEEMALRSRYSERFRQAGGDTYEIQRLRGMMIGEAEALRAAELAELRHAGEGAQDPIVAAIERQTTDLQGTLDALAAGETVFATEAELLAWLNENARVIPSTVMAKELFDVQTQDLNAFQLFSPIQQEVNSWFLFRPIQKELSAFQLFSPIQKELNAFQLFSPIQQEVNSWFLFRPIQKELSAFQLFSPIQKELNAFQLFSPIQQEVNSWFLFRPIREDIKAQHLFRPIREDVAAKDLINLSDQIRPRDMVDISKPINLNNYTSGELKGASGSTGSAPSITVNVAAGADVTEEKVVGWIQVAMDKGKFGWGGSFN